MERYTRPLALTTETTLSADDRRSLADGDLWQLGWIAAPDVDEATVNAEAVTD